MAAETSGLPEASRLERWLLAAGATRDGLASRLGPMLRRVWLVLGWAVTLRLPGELGYWLRARRLRTPLLRGFTRRRFVLPRAETPQVSVIVPSYGQVAMTRRCLASIAASPPAAAIEVIVVDDASGDKRLDRLAKVPGLRLLTTERNVGFIGACNHAAGFARGEFLLFLNNDTQVRPGWLDALLIL
ncbi:MAG: glycosyltransferase family 2 protein, partial [Acetobacteraceae bacterium]